MGRALAWLVVCISLTFVGMSCLDSSSVQCGTTTCSEGLVCAPDGVTCAGTAQVDACLEKNDSDTCAYPGVDDGRCLNQICFAPECGNGLIDTGEKCDDGNVASFDGCSADCQTNEMCGNGVYEPALGEDCDEGANNSNDRDAACRMNCSLPRCGDGVRDTGELCDDGNNTWDDGCRADCQGRFRILATPTDQLLSTVWGTESGFAVAAGVGVTLFYTGSEWTLGPGLPLPSNKLSVVAVSPSLIFGGTLNGNQGDLYKWNGSSWTVISDLPNNVGVRSFWAASADEMYASVIASGVNKLLRYNAATMTWQTFSTPGCTMEIDALTGEVTAQGTKLYFAGVSGFCVPDGAMWTFINSPGNAWQSMAIVGSDVFVSKAGASQYVRIRGGTPTFLTAPMLIQSLAVAGGKLIAVGQSVLELDPALLDSSPLAAWHGVTVPTEKVIIAVHATSPTNVFMVGDQGAALH